MKPNIPKNVIESAEKVVKLSSMKKGTFLYNIAAAFVSNNGYYTCTISNGIGDKVGTKTLIIK